MQGLLDVVARETLAVHVREQATRALTNDPVEDLRRGWDLHIAFGLDHPDAFALLYGAPSVAGSVSAIQESVAVLQGLVARIAEAPNGGPDGAPAAERAAVHAVALRALLNNAPGVLSPCRATAALRLAWRLAASAAASAGSSVAPSMPASR